jgi:hypothetical protein
MGTINEMAIFGKRFIFSDKITEESNILVYIPMISVISLEFKSTKARYRFEIPQQSIHSQAVPMEIIVQRLNKEVLSSKLEELDLE